MIRFLEKNMFWCVAPAVFGIALPSHAVAQMTGPHAINIDPMHTTQPICDGNNNDGLDIAVPIGTPVLSPSSGIIMAIWNDKTYGCGLTVMITLTDGSVASLSWLSDSMVYVGENVKQQQIVGHSGQSGNTTTPQLHYTLFTPKEGKVDPRKPRQPEQAVSERPFTDPADLKRVLDGIDSQGESENIKAGAKKYAIERFEQERALADEIYNDQLRKATNYWYAGNKNWRKIPTNIWMQLSDADKGRLKSGIDPETISRR